MSKKAPHLILSGFLILFISTGLGCGISTLTRLFPEQRTGPTPTPVVSRRDVSSDYQDRWLWRKDGIYMLHHTYPSPGLVVNDKHLALVNFLGGPISEVNQLTVLDRATGTTLWQSEPFGDLEDVTIKGGYAFILLRRGNPLNVYEISGDSKPSSTFNYFNEYAKFYITTFSASDLIYIYYNHNQSDELIIHTIDFTGTKINPLKKIQAPATFFRPFVVTQLFVFLTGEEYMGINLKTGKTLWRTASSGRIDSWPVLRDNNLIIAPGDGKRYMLLSLDVKNGRELWKTKKEFGPSITLCGSNLFALRSDAALVRLDPATGLVENEITFSPAFIDAGTSAYWLACDEQRVFIYFGDSHELFAFKIIE